MSKNDRRDAAREKARLLREEQRKKDRRNKLFLQGGLILALLAIVGVVALVLTSSIKPPSPSPLNMLSDGIKIGQGFHADKTRALKPNEEPVTSPSNSPADVLDIRVYLDYMCPYCGAFEAANAPQIKKLVQDGAATLEIHPVSILDRSSLGTNYSTRAANAAACVANFSPDNFFDFSAILFANQPKENSAGLNDGQLIAFAKEVGVSKFTNITSCITKQTFKSWVTDATQRFATNPIPGVATQPSQPGSTPAVFVNGQIYNATLTTTGEFDPQDFSAFIVKVLGSDFANSPTPSPSPSSSLVPSPSPTP